MRYRILAVLALMAVSSAAWAGLANAQIDDECRDFPIPGVACEDRPSRAGGTSIASATPVGFDVSTADRTPAGAAPGTMADTGSETLTLSLLGAGLLLAGLSLFGESARLRLRHARAHTGRWSNGWTMR